MRYRYIGFDGIEVPGHVLNKKPLNGYKVVYQPSGCLWRISEMINSASTGLEIKFWPSKKNNTVNWIKYERTGLNMWYNTAGNLDQVIHEFKDKKHGECYFIGQNLRRFYFEDNDITNDIVELVNDIENLNAEDKFNIFIRYGSEFKLYDEYMHHISLEDIIKICDKK